MNSFVLSLQFFFFLVFLLKKICNPNKKKASIKKIKLTYVRIVNPYDHMDCQSVHKSTFFWHFSHFSTMKTDQKSPYTPKKFMYTIRDQIHFQTVLNGVTYTKLWKIYGKKMTLQKWKNVTIICNWKFHKGIFGIFESCWVPQQKSWVPQATP